MKLTQQECSLMSNINLFGGTTTTHNHKPTQNNTATEDRWYFDYPQDNMNITQLQTLRLDVKQV